METFGEQKHMNYFQSKEALQITNHLLEHSKIHIPLMTSPPFCFEQAALKMQSLDSNGLINTSFAIGKSYISGGGRYVKHSGGRNRKLFPFFVYDCQIDTVHSFNDGKSS